MRKWLGLFTLLLIIMGLLSGCSVDCEKYFSDVSTGRYAEYMTEIQYAENTLVVFHNNYLKQKSECEIITMRMSVIIDDLYFAEYETNQYWIEYMDEEMMLDDFLKEHLSVELIESLSEAGVEIELYEMQ